jgi:ankyrin repeat domain-containing protein 50
MPPSTSKPPTRDLWADALKNLSPDDREAIQRFQPTSNTQQPFAETMEELLRMTREVQAKCKAKVYKIPFGVKDVILRDVAGKMIFWLNKFKDIGDIAVNFDPIHASLPWAGVRLLLQVRYVYSMESIANPLHRQRLQSTNKWET